MAGSEVCQRFASHEAHAAEYFRGMNEELTGYRHLAASEGRVKAEALNAFRTAEAKLQRGTKPRVPCERNWRRSTPTLSSNNRVLVFCMRRSTAMRKIPDLSTEKDESCTRSSLSSRPRLRRSTTSSRRRMHYYIDSANAKANKLLYGV